MFKAVRELNSNRPNKLLIKDSSGAVVGQPEETAEIVAKHFVGLFYSSNKELETNHVMAVAKVPLISPITIKEVKEATSKLNNGRATGPDGISGELLKYGGHQLHKQIADILNQSIEKSIDLELGKGTLIVLQKPGKPPGVMSSLRPIVLLNTIRKTLSLITLITFKISYRKIPATESERLQTIP